MPRKTTNPKSKKRSRQKVLLDTVVHSNAAGVDIGAEELVAAVEPGCCPEPVQTFQTTTAQLHRFKDWLLSCGVKTVAMESTGNYWIASYQILEEAGIEVCLVNARHVKGVPGKKSDVCDAQWLQKLHTAGLLNASFRPHADIIPMRYLMRQRAELIAAAAKQIQHMQKVLTEMNVKLHHVFSDLDGHSAQRIITAILEGQREGEALWALRDPHCRSKKEDFLASIEGDWREEYLFVLGACQKQWLQIREMMLDYDRKIQSVLERIETDPVQQSERDQGQSKRVIRKTKNDLQFDVVKEAERFYGVDLTTLDGISSGTLATLMSELGTRSQLLEAFPTASRFTSWLTLCPHNRISGGKLLGKGRTRKSANRITTCLRMAAFALARSKTRLGEYCRMMKGRLGKAEGITAVAHKLARILYGMIKSLCAYNEEHCFQMNAKQKARRLANIHKLATKLGYRLIPNTQENPPQSLDPALQQAP